MINTLNFQSIFYIDLTKIQKLCLLFAPVVINLKVYIIKKNAIKSYRCWENKDETKKLKEAINFSDIK